ncbi:hypothetical protein [Capnocytophaga sp. G2]|jgi:hypothetical protein|uniref:hypothetical protein n=1 Tax=Capnocytophaga sp. G2 TaxID=3110695 RepID=UPI002B46AB40|nr:hypothetical protein [Capnocytophaga sp. G2]MEB3005742.1 hypothetical protein [Capnocytophaga sp. G2]
MRSVNLKHIGDAMDRKTYSLSDIRKERGEEYLRSYILLWLVYLNELLDLNKPLNESQMRLCAEEILADYGYLKISEIAYIFKRLINGEYGALYERLSVAKVMSLFRDYDKERIDFVIEEREREHNEFRYEESREETYSEAFKRKVKRLIR